MENTPKQRIVGLGIWKEFEILFNKAMNQDNRENKDISTEVTT